MIELALYRTVYNPDPDTPRRQNPAPATHRRYTRLFKCAQRPAQPITALNSLNARGITMFKLSTSSLTLGLIVAGGLALANVASASESEAFSMKQLAHGYSQAQADSAEKPAEGKCGEGKCGAGE